MATIRKLMSFEDRLKGKKGHLRQWSLGKRVDYSGRSVIIGEPTLTMDECYLPKEMVLELLKPQMISRLVKYGFAYSKKYALRIIDARKPEIWPLLEEIVETEYPFFLLNRAPTLHKYNIGCFKAKLWNKKAIGVPPLVCSAFNADFDGDQMAVYPLISEESKFEGAILMAFSRNLISTTNGNLVIAASKDMVLGIYALSLDSAHAESERLKYFYDIREVENSYLHGHIEINESIYCKISEINNDGSFTSRIVKTTYGRLMIWELVPNHPQLRFDLVNRVFVSKDTNNLMKLVLRHAGETALAKFADDIKMLGMNYAAKFGISVGKDDLFDIEGRDSVVEKTIDSQMKFEEQYRDGLVTLQEMENKIWTLWDSVISAGKKKIAEFLTKNKHNSVGLIVNSGARGSSSQLSQMLFCKGFLNIGAGQSAIVHGNHKIGLSPLDYYKSGMSARESCKTVAIDTASSGYLTRKLAHVANDVIITSLDCETNQYIIARNLFKNGTLFSEVYDQIIGRVVGADIHNTITKELLVSKNVMITEEVVEVLKKNHIVEIPLRSPAMCENIKGICAACYGGNPKLVCIGEGVGILAAQSIGEPATQCTMRTYHTGGASQFDFIETTITTPFGGTVHFSENAKFLVTKADKQILISNNVKIFIKNEMNQTVAVFDIPYGANVLVKNKEKVPDNAVLSVSSMSRPIISEIEGTCDFFSFEEKVSYENVVDEATNKNKKIITKSRLSPSIVIKSKKEEKIYYIPDNTIIEVEPGELVEAGQVIGYTRSVIKSIDIVSGLARLISLFENRQPDHEAILASFDGTVIIEKDKKSKTFLKLINEAGDKTLLYSVVDAELLVHNGTKVQKGEMLTMGGLKTQDILDSRGYSELIDSFIMDIQQIFKQNGLTLNNRHIEVVLKQLCRRFEIEDPKSTGYVQGLTIDYSEYKQICKKCIASHKPMPKVRRLIYGVTSAVLSSNGFLGAVSFEQLVSLVSKVLFTYTSVDEGFAYDDLSSINSNIMLAGSDIPVGTSAELKRILEIEIPNLKDKESDTVPATLDM